MLIYRCETCGTLNRVPPERKGQRPKCGRCKNSVDVSGHPHEVDDLGLEATVAASPVPVLVDFWAPWCGPCQMAAPIVEDLAEEKAGDLLVLKVNTDEAQAAAQKYGVRGIPCFVLFSGGKEVSRQTGVLPPDKMKRWVEQNA